MRSTRRPARTVRFVAPVLGSLLLFLGCTLVPVDDFSSGRSLSLRFSSSHHPYANGEIIFSHTIHDSLECETCHGESRSAEEILAGELPPMRTCFVCHDGRTQSQSCDVCHVTNRRERKPRFHAGRWIAHHRDMAHRESYKCSLCHRESECQQCHATQKPRSHTPRFNRTTHGMLAIQDRRSCATCHRGDFCVECHEQPPPSHTPTFMGPLGHRQIARLKLRSCQVCHVFQNDCARAGCHSQSP